MWKLLVGFFLFAALAIFIMSKGGDIDMSGEKHDVTAGHSEAPSAASEPVSLPASAPASAAPAVLAPASAAASS